MLDLTLQMQFVPGSNLKGNVTGANWTLLLPQLELGRTLCLGAPSVATLSMLSPLAEEVLVWEPHGARRRRLAQQIEVAGYANVVLAARPQAVWQLPEQRVDLIYHVDAGFPLQNPAELRSLLRPNGNLYLEVQGSLKYNSLSRQLRRSRGAGFQKPLWLWLTPLRGEISAAVPLEDLHTRDYFIRHNHYASSSNLSMLKKAERALIRRGLATKVWPRTGAMFRAGADRDLQQPPMYLRNLASLAGLDFDQSRWGLWARGAYRSQKAMLFLFSADGSRPEQAVKMTRDAAFNARLENEYYAVSKLCKIDRQHREHVPEGLFLGHPGGLAVVGESMMEGRPFKESTDGTATCRYVCDAVEWLAHLGESTVKAVDPNRVAQALGQLFERFTSIYRLQPHEHDFLREQIARVAASPNAFPAVFQHGDPGPWNMLVRPSGHVAFLDWESAEQSGMPLWDLFYFLRSYSMLGRVRGVRSRLSTFACHFLEESPLLPLLLEATEYYCTRVGLSPALVEPLFYTCWMHRALKEANRLTPEKLEQGNFIALLRLCIERREAPTLRRLFGTSGVRAHATAA